MGIKGIIREIEISRVLNQPLDGDALVIQTFFNDLLNGLEIDTLDKYPDSIFFIKNGHDVYMEQDYKNERLFCSYNRIWSFFEGDLSLDYQEISDLIKVMVEQQLKEMVFTPPENASVLYNGVEKQLKNKVFTPQGYHSLKEMWVEQQLKEKVFTPNINRFPKDFMVEQQLKEKVFTPYRDCKDTI